MNIQFFFYIEYLLRLVIQIFPMGNVVTPNKMPLKPCVLVSYIEHIIPKANVGFLPSSRMCGGETNPFITAL